MSNPEDVATGGCLCGAVRYVVGRPLRNVVLCHCAMCRRTHGHVAAYTSAPKSALELVESRGLKWYRSSDVARRGFCSECGASVFWERLAGDLVSIAAGTLDTPTGSDDWRCTSYVDSAGDYYTIDTTIPQRAG